MSTPGPEVSARAPSPPARARIAVRDPELAAVLAARGYRAQPGHEGAHAVVATAVAEAREAIERGQATLLRADAPGAVEHLESTGQAECVFTGAADLCERLEWLEGTGWDPPPAAGRVELAARLVEARGWLAALREEERAMQAAHDIDVEQRRRHERALEEHRDHLIGRVADLDVRLRVTEAARVDAQARLDAVLGSWSWRLLAPARALGARLRRVAARIRRLRGGDRR